MYGHPSSSAVDRSTTGSRHARTPSSFTGAPGPASPPRAEFPRAGDASDSSGTGGPGNYRRTSIPPHLQGSSWSNGAGRGGKGHNSHLRRGSVVDIAADFLGPAATENLERVRQQSSKLEDKIDGWTRPFRPYLPGIGRFLIVVTFLEDALRIMTQITGR